MSNLTNEEGEERREGGISSTGKDERRDHPRKSDLCPKFFFFFFVFFSVAGVSFENHRVGLVS